MPDPDVVAVCCGGAGLVAGIAAGLKLSGCEKCRVYAVEPTGGTFNITNNREHKHYSVVSNGGIQCSEGLNLLLRW